MTYRRAFSKWWDDASYLPISALSRCFSAMLVASIFSIIVSSGSADAEGIVLSQHRRLAARAPLLPNDDIAGDSLMGRAVAMPCGASSRLQIAAAHKLCLFIAFHAYQANMKMLNRLSTISNQSLLKSLVNGVKRGSISVWSIAVKWRP